MPGHTNPITDFCLNFFKQVLQDREGINYTVSTTGMYLTMAGVEAASKNKVAWELEKVLGCDYSFLLSNHRNTLFSYIKKIYKHLNRSGELVARIFTAVKLKRSYVELLNGMFDITAEYLSFNPPSAAVDIINRWVEERTHGRVTNFLKESFIKPYTVLVFVNTIYFKARWNDGFDEKLTKDDEFYLENAETVTVPFMNRKGEAKVYEDPIGRFRALILDFESEKYQGVFLLPTKHMTLKELTLTLKEPDLVNLIGRSEESELNIKIPKFKVDQKTKAKKILKALGVTSIFEKSKTDLGNMSDVPMFVDDIIQRSTVKIREKGRTYVTDTDDSEYVHTSAKPFQADRPFIFIIWDGKLGIPLFINAIYDPSKT